MHIDLDVKEEIFVAKGTRTIEKGWHVYYGQYVTLEEEELPSVAEGQIVDVKKITMHEKETQPPKRYTPSSIIKELEKRNLGTKSTRAQIVDTLVQRGYVSGKTLTATDIGIKTCEALEKAIPGILDEELTRHFELEMDEIREGKKTEPEVLEEAKAVLIKLFADFKKHEKEIGERLVEANKETRTKESTIGKCPNCDKGTLMIRRGKFGLFAACDAYPDCKTTFSLPKGALVKVTEKICEHCKHPMIAVIRKGKQPQELCINLECPSKKQQAAEGGEKKEVKGIKGGKDGDKCPLCKEGNLILRKSIYGEFLGCSKYPKCRYTEKLG
jgi:DNA topoisomerase-1